MSSILIICPDYVSHYLPLSAVAAALRHRGHQMVVATGRGLQAQVIAAGYDYQPLVLGPGSNPGLIRPEEQSPEERRQLERFFNATRAGMVPTLLHQARNRRRDLLFEPEQVGISIEELLRRVAPDTVVVDQLAYGATAALRGLGRPFISFHPGHPSAISVSWPYGYPPRFPPRIRVDPQGLSQLETTSRDVVARFTAEYNAAMAAIDPEADPVSDAFAAVSPQRTLINYPAALGDVYGLPVTTRYIGSSIRRQDLPGGTGRRFLSSSRPRIYASLGTFFSGRSDILRKLVAAFKGEPVELVLASGVTPLAELGGIPDHWTVAEYLPQPALIRTSDLVITHGGNNTVTEALTAGVPLLVGPLSTDQFAAGADIESAGLGRVFDPNFDEASSIAALAWEVLAGDAPAVAGELGRELRRRPGHEYAASLIEEPMREPVGT